MICRDTPVHRTQAGPVGQVRRRSTVAVDHLVVSQLVADAAGRAGPFLAFCPVSGSGSGSYSAGLHGKFRSVSRMRKSRTVLVLRMTHRKWKKLSTARHSWASRPGNMLSCCLVSLHFLWVILSTSTVQSWPKKVCPRLRDSASDFGGEFTQRRTNFFGHLCI